MSQTNTYAGDVSAVDAWRDLEASPDAVLIDVRTAAEWAFVGLPSLTSIGKAPLLVAWNEFPSGAQLPDFAVRLQAALARGRRRRRCAALFPVSLGRTQPQCGDRRNGRRPPARLQHRTGLRGALDADRHRATPGSWKAEGLPWVQS